MNLIQLYITGEEFYDIQLLLLINTQLTQKFPSDFWGVILSFHWV